jgi:hypothetical protein
MSPTATAPRAATLLPSAEQEENILNPDESTNKDGTSHKQDEKDAKQNKNKALHAVPSGEQDHQQEDENKKPAAQKEKSKESDNVKPSFSKATVPGVEYIDSEVLASYSKAPGPGVLEYIDSDVLAPREQTDEKKPAFETQKSKSDDDTKVEAGMIEGMSSTNTPGAVQVIPITLKREEKPASKTQKSNNDDDAQVGAGIEAISSTNTPGETSRTPGAVRFRPVTLDKSNDWASEELMEKSVMSATTSWAGQQEDPENLTRGTLLEATKVDSVRMTLVSAVPAEDHNCFKVPRGNRKAKMLVIGACLVLVALVVGLVVAFAGGSSDNTEKEPEVTPDTFFDTVGDPLDGPEPDGTYGVSVATNRDGSRIAIAGLFGVDVYERNMQLTDSDWEMIGNIQGDAANVQSAKGDFKSLLIRAPLLTTMSLDGSVVAVGWPLHNIDDVNTTIGLVEIYRFKESLSWERQGDSLFGKASGDMFGASLSLSEDGNTLAVGAAGNGGYTEVYVLDSDGWNQQGGTVTSLDHELDAFSVSLSNDGATLAVGGIPDANDGAVAQVFHLVSGEWEKRGSAIGGRVHIGETIYLADLSGDGSTIVVSNYYTTEARENTGLGLDVRAFIWSADTDNWEPLGQNMHSGNMAEKSGYFVSLSDDGRTIAMGDPGARVVGQGAVSGHAHFFAFKGGEWLQLGPNYEGEAAGDQFGYAVALSGNGDYLVASAPYNRASGEERGRVMVLTAAMPTGN